MLTLILLTLLAAFFGAGLVAGVATVFLGVVKTQAVVSTVIDSGFQGAVKALADVSTVIEAGIRGAFKAAAAVVPVWATVLACVKAASVVDVTTAALLRVRNVEAAFVARRNNTLQARANGLAAGAPVTGAPLTVGNGAALDGFQVAFGTCAIKRVPAVNTCVKVVGPASGPMSWHPSPHQMRGAPGWPDPCLAGPPDIPVPRGWPPGLI